jgi:hypothetical protein
MRRMRDLQLPLLTPTFFFLLVINITDSFTDSFGIVDTLTGGGPFRATDLMVYKIYADGFRGFDYSGAAAQSIILMLPRHGADLRPVPLCRAARPLHLRAAMIERTPRPEHRSPMLILLSGLMIILVPIWLAFCRRHPRHAAVNSAPVEFWPGDQLGRTCRKPGRKSDFGTRSSSTPSSSPSAWSWARSSWPASPPSRWCSSTSAAGW